MGAREGWPDTLAGWLSLIESRHPKGVAGIELGLERVASVARCMPASHNPRVFTVGGTNGKGSVCAYLQIILARAGYRVGGYASPHLIDFAERIRLDTSPASETELLPVFAEVESAREETGASLTYFEFITLVAWRLFVREKVDVAVLEVGLGGRLDAVNLFDADCAVITNIALDHQDWLGPDRETIGHEKAGIMRSGRPVVVAEAAPPASLLQHATAVGAQLLCLGRDYGYEGDRQQWRWWGRRKGGEIVRRGGLAAPGLRGRHQVGNAAAALMALDAVRAVLPVSMGAIRRGLIEVELAGRFQVVPGRPTIILDVAHNPHAMAALASNLGDMAYHPVTHAVVGMLADKALAESLAAVAGRIDRWYLAPLPGPRGASVADLREALLQVAPQAAWQSFDSVSEALSSARKVASEDDRIAVFGSFLTVADVMTTLTGATEHAS